MQKGSGQASWYFIGCVLFEMLIKCGEHYETDMYGEVRDRNSEGLEPYK